MVHEGVRGRDGRNLDPLYAVLRRARLHRRVPKDARRFRRAVLRRRVKAEDDGVAGLGADQRLEHGGGGGVRHRRHARHHAHRLRHFDVAFQVVFVDYAHRLLVLDGVPDILGGKDILDDLVFEHTAPGLIHRHVREQHVVLKPGQRHRMHRIVHLLLVHLQVFGQRLVRVFNQLVNHPLDIRRTFLGRGFRFAFHGTSSSRTLVRAALSPARDKSIL